MLRPRSRLAPVTNAIPGGVDMRGFLPLAAGRAGEWAIRRLRSELSGVGRNDLLLWRSRLRGSLEFGAARWGGGAVDPLGVVRERLCRQLPDAGAGVGRHGGDILVDAVRIALIHQQADR